MSEAAPPASLLALLSDCDEVARHLSRAAVVHGRASGELRTMRDSTELTARLEVARQLLDGEDGGALSLLMSLVSPDSVAGDEVQVAAALCLERLMDALQLEAIGVRGEHLVLGSGELAEFDVRGLAFLAPERATYRLVRVGWGVAGHIVARPLIERIGAEEEPMAVR